MQLPCGYAVRCNIAAIKVKSFEGLKAHKAGDYTRFPHSKRMRVQDSPWIGRWSIAG